MAQQSFASLAVLVALAFAIMALQGCASPAQRTASAIVAIPPAEAATPEFHGASIGRDALRSRVPAEG